MLRKTAYPVLAVAALGLAFSFNGCSCETQLGTPPKTVEPPPPPPPPVPPPAPAIEPAPAAAAPDRELEKLKGLGKAKIEGDQIKIPGKLEFDVDKATIRNDTGSTEILTTLADVLKQNPNVTKIRIEGHTDDSGSSEHNHRLSKDRAAAVAKYLQDHGVDPKRVEVVGHGEDKPIVPNDNELHKQVNRRTEFHVLEIDGKALPAAATTGVGATAAATVAKGVTPPATAGSTTITNPPPAMSAKPKIGETVQKGGGK